MHTNRLTRTFFCASRREPVARLVVTTAGNRHEVDHPEAIIVRGGVSLFLAPGNVPVIFDHDGVSEVVGDLASRTAEV